MNDSLDGRLTWTERAMMKILLRPISSSSRMKMVVIMCQLLREYLRMQ